MTSHAGHNHPNTPAARAKCRKAGGNAAPFLATAPVPTPRTIVAGEHMTPDQALRITSNLLADHNLTGWRVTFDNARRRAGRCSYTHRTISLSRPLMAQRSFDDTHDTITHELAHALTPGHDHDHVWAAKHRELGGNGARTFSHVDTTAPWIGTCEHGKTFTRYRSPEGRRYRCRCVRGGSLVTWEYRP